MCVGEVGFRNGLLLQRYAFRTVRGSLRGVTQAELRYNPHQRPQRSHRIILHYDGGEFPLSFAYDTVFKQSKDEVIGAINALVART
jgi:hypothetical protein